MPERHAYLGPEGTFSEAALATLPLPTDAAREPVPSVPAALDAVRRGDATSAVVPLENSVEGAVTSTLDELAAGEPLRIVGEVLLAVELALLVRPGTALDDVKRLITHPHAQAQCRRWLAHRLPDGEVVTAASTAAAAMAVSDPTAPYDAAISAPIAADHYGLAVLESGIGDRADAVTRFVQVTRPGPVVASTGADRTSLVAFIADDHPGALLEILSEFASRGINLSRIESRPTGDGLGRYCFSIDCEGHVAEPRVGEALSGLRRVCADVRFLGSYPRADGERHRVRPGTSEADYTRAAGWLERAKLGME